MFYEITAALQKSCFSRIGGVMISVLASSALDRGIGENQRLWNWYLWLLRLAHSIKEKEQRHVGSKSG